MSRDGESQLAHAVDARHRLYDADLVGIIVADTRGRIREANDTFLRLVGYDREDLVEGTIRWDDMTPPEWRHVDQRMVEELAAQGVTNTWELEYARRDGSRVPVLVRARLLDGSSTDCIAFVLDDTHRRGAEDALRESEERFRLLVGHIGDAIFMLDPAGKVVTWTPAAERILGYTEAEALTLSAVDFLPPDQRGAAVLSGELATALVNGRFEEDGWRLRKGDRPMWARVVICPIFGPHRELRGFAQIVQDRTDLRAAEEALARQTAELARSNMELETFASVAAHDLQEPLRKLRTFGDRLKRRFASSVDPDASALVDRMDDAAARMQTLIDGLLTYARLGRRPQAFKPVDLDRVVRDVLGDLSPAIEAAGARVEAASLPSVSVDATQMRQVFQNLVSNSLKFAKKGVPPVIKVTAAPAGAGNWELRIEDNGIGFEPKYSERIFALFARLHGRADYGGSGLGLAICRRVIERHGGTIVAEGRPGQGAIFTIRLPSNGGNTARSES